MKPLFNIFILLVAAIIPLAVKGQAVSFSFSGFVREKGSQESLPGVSIYIPSLKQGIPSNNYGFYAFKLPAGEYLVEVSAVGFKKQQLQVLLSKDLKLDILLEPFAQLAEVTISAAAGKSISEASQMSAIDIPVNQIKDIPALLGEKDVFKVIKLLPGVQKGMEGSSGFYVRGGGPDQNLIMLDDAVVYNANHLFGFFSIFNGDALKSVELIKGGFPARYGERLSSVLVMNMKDGNKEKLTGEAGIGLISSRFTLEGPIQKNKSSFLVSGRRTYLDLLARPFLSKEDKAGYFFYDMNAKANFTLDSINKVFVSGYFGRDKFYTKSKYDSNDLEKGNFNWGNATITTRWNHLFNSRFFANTSLIYSDYQLNLNYQDKYDDEFYELNYTSGIRDLGGKFDIDYAPGGRHYLRAGLKTVWHRFTPRARIEKGSSEYQNTRDVTRYHSYEYAVYAEDDWSPFEHFSVNMGVRAAVFRTGGRSYDNIEPRVSMRASLSGVTSLKLSYARMNQYLHLLSNTGIGLPTDLWVPSTTKILPERSQQVAGGLARDLPAHNLLFSAEVYYKSMKNIISYREGASFLDPEDDDAKQDVNFEDNVTSGTGKSYGLELMLQRKSGRLSGWVGYTLAWTRYRFPELNFGKEFYPRHDRRHDVSVVCIYKLSEKLKLTGTWVYGSGSALSIPRSEYSTYRSGANFYSGIGNLNPYKGVQQTSVTDFGERGTFRSEPYHRLDVGLQFFKKKKKTERTFELGLYNAYSHLNPFYYYNDTGADDRSVLKKVALFPIIPSVSWNYKF
ncbi:TonB-dependent receptor [Hufsiella ginkgonis]|uniref:TonB-dependent receptor plug domain-containing protein n=1 Tax=Hufsiella ginkgonis TaxID=2695274 RepID=A0A7K1Y423_9SPHI|nr:TonB-dependent receptor [Hufsiella ginkgonis]MXV17992.1 TonB-dependent receptor plug domain-containing protein [Hufsiella ginkgonis]